MPSGQDEQADGAARTEDGRETRLLRETGAYAIEASVCEAAQVERRLRENAERECPVGRKRQRPVRVHVGAVLEMHVLDGGHRQQREREDLQRSPQDEQPKDEDGRGELADEDRERRE